MGPVKARTYQHASIWAGAILVGCAAAAYAKLISAAQRWFLGNFEQHSYVLTWASPLLFLVAAALVRIIAPDAKGSGIPQVLEAIEAGKADHHSEQPWRLPLVSFRTAFV